MDPSSRLRETQPYDANALSVLKEHQVLMLPSLRCEQVLAAILESAEEAIIGIALDGSIELWSRGAERLYGYTAAEVTGVALTSLLPINEGPSLQAVLEAARDGKMTESETVERLNRLGTKLSVGLRRQAMRDEQGVVTGILEMGRATRQKTQDTPSETQPRLLVEHAGAAMDNGSELADHIELGLGFAVLRCTRGRPARADSIGVPEMQ